MSLNVNVTNTLNATIEAVKSVIPLAMTIGKPALMSAPLDAEMGVLIGITGQIRGRMVLKSQETTFSKLGATMFGMALEGDMLQSFAGELGNMVAGNLSTVLSKNGTQVDITPPTVIVGSTKLYGFEKALRLPIELDGAGEINIVLMLED